MVCPSLSLLVNCFFNEKPKEDGTLYQEEGVLITDHKENITNIITVENKQRPSQIII